MKAGSARKYTRRANISNFRDIKNQISRVASKKDASRERAFSRAFPEGITVQSSNEMATRWPHFFSRERGGYLKQRFYPDVERPNSCQSRSST